MSEGLRTAIRALAARWRLRVWVVLAAGLGISLSWVPLFGVLGFELALAAAVFAAVMGLDVGSALARELQRISGGVERTYAGRMMAAATAVASGLAVAVAAIPAVIAAIRGIWTPACDGWFGIESYLAMPVATAALAGAVGHALGVVCGPRRLVGAAVAQLPAVAVAVAALWRFYREPPVFTYNAILGYFPGNLYDENIRLSWPLLWSRLEDLGWVLALVAGVTLGLDVPRHRMGRMARPAGRRLGALAVAAGCVAGAAVLHAFGGALGYAPDAGDLAQVLSGRVETAHFIIHYAHTEEIDAGIAAIAEDHEFRYAEVVAELGGVAPEGKLVSFYFADREQKARWFGARDVEMAKPWRREIYLEHRVFPHGSLRHEVAHAVASAFGDPLFGVAARHGVLANPGLIEGLAVALDWPGSYDQPTPHEQVRAMADLGIEPSIGPLLSLEFFAVSSARGYTTAGSFLRFLLDRYGAGKLRALYRSGGDFEAAYGVAQPALEGQWRQMLAQIALPPGASEALRERFRVGSVFARPCPHAIAARRERAARALGAGDREAAAALLRENCSEAPREPRYRMDLGAVLAGGDATERAEAVATWTALSRDAEHVTSTVRVEALERLAREAAARGDRPAVEARIREAAALPVDANGRRQLEAEQLALGHRGPAAVPLYGYFFVPGPIDAVQFAAWAEAAEPELGFAHYLLGLQRLGQGDWVQATAELDRALALGLPDVLFVRNAARRLAVAAYLGRDRARLDRAIATLSGGDMTTPDHLLAKDWRDRAAFDGKH